MGTKRRIEIRVQTHQVLKIHQGSQVTLAWCKVCKQQVEMIPLEKATNLNSDSPGPQVQSERLHITELAGERPFVCLRSLFE